MDIQIFNAKKYNIDANEIKAKILKACHHQNFKGYIGIEFVDNNQIKKLNKKYRGINKVTDVLSFSTKTQNKNQVFGEIVISPEYAKKYNIDAKEIIDLIIHGIVHLLGYDHKKDENGWNKMLKKIEKG